VAQVYSFGEQGVFSITTPEWTWEYNTTTNAWHRRDSYGHPHWRATSATVFDRHWYVQDKHGPQLLQVAPGIYRELDTRMRCRIESAPLKAFPATVRVPSVDIDISVALGKDNVPSPSETNPSGMISWSHDGGANWGRPLARSLGRVGRYSNKVTVNNLGRSTHHGIMLRIDVTDPVPVVLTHAVSTRVKPARPRGVKI
jgi:hypothetical protein